MNPLTCSELVELVTDYLEDALPPGTRRRVEAHLAECVDCAAYVEQVRATIALTGRLDAGQLAPAACAELLSHFRDL